MNWTLGTEEISEPPKGYEGFVYKITNNLTGQKYIGRKFFYSIRKVKGKKKRQRTEADWKNYWSSSKILQEDVKTLGEENFTREILVMCKTRGDCNRIETQMLWANNVLEDTMWYNDSIGNHKAAPQHIMEARIYGKQ